MVRLVEVGLEPGKRACPPLSSAGALSGGQLSPGSAGAEAPGNFHHLAGLWRQLQQQGLIDAQRISRIRPLIPRDAVAEHDRGRQRRHLLDEGCRCAAKPAGAEPIPVEACAEAGLGIAALIARQGAGRGAGEPAGAGDSDRPGFGIAAGEAEGSAMGLGRGHG